MPPRQYVLGHESDCRFSPLKLSDWPNSQLAQWRGCVAILSQWLGFVPNFHQPAQDQDNNGPDNALAQRHLAQERR